MHKSQGIKNFAFLSDFYTPITKQNCLLRFTVLISFLQIVSCNVSTLICRTKPKFILNQFGACEAPHLIFIIPHSSMQRFADRIYFSRVSLQHNP